MLQYPMLRPMVNEKMTKRMRKTRRTKKRKRREGRGGRWAGGGGERELRCVLRLGGSLIRATDPRASAHSRLRASTGLSPPKRRGVVLDADVDELAGRLGIDTMRTTVRRLSGGQRQRVALAAALVGRPEVLFLDEPTAGLDPHARLEVWQLIREVRDDGVAVVLTTHSFEEAERLADHLVIVSDGRTVAEGRPADVVGRGSLEQVYFALTRRAAG